MYARGLGQNQGAESGQGQGAESGQGRSVRKKEEGRGRGRGAAYLQGQI